MITFPLYLYNDSQSVLSFDDVGLEIGIGDFFEIESEERMMELIEDPSSTISLALKNNQIPIATSNTIFPPVSVLTTSEVSALINQNQILISSTFFTSIFVTFNNEETYVETTLNDDRISSLSVIVCSFVGDEEIAIQNIVCGVKSQKAGSCIIFAGTNMGATGTYKINIMVG